MKKRLYIKSVMAAALLAMTVSSCSDYLDVNEDPNNPTSVTPELILPPAQHFTAFYMHRDRGVNHLGNMFMYNWSESEGFSWYNDEFGYFVTTNFYTQNFDNAYTSPLKQYQQLVNLGAGYNNYVAIGKIMKAYHFQLLVDQYGDVPYFQALQRGANSTPAYDDAQEIYANLLVELTEAIDLIKTADATSPSPGDKDVMFGGEMTDWIRLANTIKIRILNRESGVVPQATIDTELAAIAAEGTGFITADVVVNPGYINEENKQNPFWAAFGADAGGTATLTNNATCATQYVLDVLTANSDPRIDRLYEKPATGHKGVEQGLDLVSGSGYAPAFVSNIGPGIKSTATMPSKIFLVSEHLFNLAELALNGFGGDPALLYDEAVTASFVSLGLTAAQATTYLAQSKENVNYAFSTDKLEAIITQKWTAVNGITAEQSWFDYSRTGFPDDLPISAEASTTDRPVRLFYPASEKSANAGNVPEQPNAFTGKIFWAN